MLAIASWSFDAPSETFVRNHVRMIAPGETVVLCQNQPEVNGLEVPMLSSSDPWWRPPRILGWRLGHVVAAGWQNWVGAGACVKDRRRIRAFFERYKPSAVLAEYGPTGCLLWRICRSCSVPLYVHFHGCDASVLLRDKNWVRRYRLMFEAAAGVIAPSKFLGSRLSEIGCPAAKLHVIPYGVDAQRFVPTRRLPQRMLAVGRLVEKKAPHVTIEAFARVRQRFPKVELDIVGEGPLAYRCATLIHDFGLDDCVRIHGMKPHEFVADLMQQASLFVQHSVVASDGDAEGLPVAILEAMSAALPVVSTRHSGIPEAVEEGATGLLVDEHDVSGMTDAMAQLLDDPGRAAAMGMAGRQRVIEHFTQEQARDRLRAVMGLPRIALATHRAV
jgi:colanic acid/amylovoran biosynthesis glycosyltransferase